MFALVIGVTDGILTALTLAAGRVFESPSNSLSLGLAVRISAASSLSGIFVFFTAEYIRHRGELLRAERQLSLTTHGRLAATRLVRAALWETLQNAILSSVCNFLGALAPLIVGALLPHMPWVAIAVALALLATLGAISGHLTHGNAFLWSIALVAAGLALTWAGAEFHVV